MGVENRLIFRTKSSLEAGSGCGFSLVTSYKLTNNHKGIFKKAKEGKSMNTMELETAADQSGNAPRATGG